MSDSEDGVSRRGFLRTAAAGTTAAAAAASGAAAQEGTTTGDDTGNQTTSDDGGGAQTVTVEVGSDGDDLVYTPGTDEPLYISPGTTVEFVWKGTLVHNIVVDAQPSGASWSGYESLEAAPFTYSHTFDTLGTYEYYCQPHRNQGMVGTIVVNQNGEAPPDTGYETILPDSAQTLAVAATGTMVSVLGLAYFFLKYGGEYGELE